ncbi:MAG TPA: hypothetical protein VFC63_22115 [Blastocatellia bacterium]|nr:hypothetical protein [Blastocatellia bacterium]
MIHPIAQWFEKVLVGYSPRRTAAIAPYIPQALMDQLQHIGFRHQLKYVNARSKFYRERFAELGINVNRITHPSQMGSFFTYAEEVRQRPSEDFLCAKPQIAFETTGTTSAIPKRIYFSNEEMDIVGRFAAVGMWNLGLRPDDRLVSAFDYSFWVSGPTIRAATNVIGCFHVEAGKIDPMEFYERSRSYNFNVIVGEPSWLMRLSEIAEREGIWPVKFFLAGGENMTEQTREYIEQVWQSNVYLNYGQTEAFGALGLECPEKRGYHLNELNFFYEIADPDEDGYGKLAYTTLSRKVMPLVRYHANDVTRIIEERCPCGLPSRMLAKVRCRADEMIVCGMGNISPWIFEQLLRDIDGIGDDWQVAIVRPGIKDVVEFRIETTDSSVDRQTIEKTIEQRLQKDFPDFWKNKIMGLYDLAFSYSRVGSLRTGRKLLRLVDQREQLLFSR